MQLVDLIPFIINADKLEQFYRLEKLNSESEALLIYMKNSLSIESEIKIFGIEETEDELVYEVEGVRYLQLFPIDHAVELISSDLNLIGKGYSDLEIAKRLLQYRAKDA